MENEQNSQQIPKHVALILDGNRRWAKERGLTSLEGHKKGEEKVREAPEWFFDKGVETVTIFAFSTENWKRKKEEVDYLMKLLKEAVDKELDKAIERGFRIVISGRYDELPDELSDRCREAVTRTKENKKGTLNICLNYGGRAEIVDAVKKILAESKGEDAIDEESISAHLYHPELGSPDVIVRTSGEKRLSGFQLWGSAYSEFIFLDKYWPDFSKEDAEYVIEEFSGRKRRFGGG
jgi:undecaprenyl diphosphate synthase